MIRRCCSSPSAILWWRRWQWRPASQQWRNGLCSSNAGPEDVHWWWKWRLYRWQFSECLRWYGNGSGQQVIRQSVRVRQRFFRRQQGICRPASWRDGPEDVYAEPGRLRWWRHVWLDGHGQQVPLKLSEQGTG
jgi:hypothetical protein